ncbi:MAG: flagellar hook-basal body complex protein FliE [Paracoccaceae bacterium]
MDIRSTIAATGYAINRPATAPDPSPGGAIAKAASDFAQSLHQTETTAKTALMGGADPHALVTALAQTELAIETAVTMRNKVVEAYQEILRMPV